MWTVAAVVLALVGADGQEAEQLFRRMEERLAKAKTLECTVELKGETKEGGGGAAILLGGTLLLAEGNRERLELRERDKEKELWHLWVSNGSRAVLVQKGSPRSVHDTPADQNAEMLMALARVGVMVPLMPLPPVEAADSKDRFRVSEFRLGRKDKIGERETQRLDYQLSVKGQMEPLSIAVWVDLKTALPVRRVVSAREGEGTFRLTENYGKLALDGKIDAKQFELPK